MKAFRSLAALLLTFTAGIGIAHAQTARVCQFAGLGHMVTFDGKPFDVTRSFGTFSLVESDALSVQVSTAPSATNAQAAALSKVAVRSGNTVYLFDTNGLKQVSGDAAGITATATPSTVNQGGSAKLRMSDTSLISIAHNARMNDGSWASNLIISLPPSAAGKLRGLCGNFDGNPANDFVTPSGQAVQDVSALAIGWTPQPAQDLFAGIPSAAASTLPVISTAPAAAAAPAAAPTSEPSRVCQFVGLGHTMTFDGKPFDLTRSFGTFSLLESDALSIQVSTASSVANPAAAAAAGVAVRFGNAVYLFDTNGLKQVSGGSAGVTPTVMPPGGDGRQNAKLTMSDGSAVEFAQNQRLSTQAWASDIRISLPTSASGKVRGLCGNFDGNPANDLVTPSGQAMQDINQLAIAWAPPTGQALVAGTAPAPAVASAGSTAPDQFGAVKLFKTTSPAAGHPSAQMCLPAGFRLLGGGASLSTTGVGNYLTASYPEGQCWKAEAKDHLVQSIATMDVYAIGIYDPSGVIPIVTLSSTSQAAAHPAVISPPLPPPFIMTGGGAKVSYGGAGNILIASYPNDGNPPNSWVAASKDHEVSDPATVTAYVIGMLPFAPTGQKFDIVKVVASQANPAAAAEATVALPQGYSVIGGGGLAISTTQAGSLLTDSYPTGNGWMVRSHDRDVSDPAKIAVWAIGIRQVQ
jgi:hypothetical protein